VRDAEESGVKLCRMLCVCFARLCLRLQDSTRRFTALSCATRSRC